MVGRSRLAPVFAVAVLTGTYAHIWPSFANAQVCGARDDMVAGMEARYQEVPEALGLSNAGTLVEVLVSPDGRTWTIISTLPNGLACAIAAGEHWGAAAPRTAGDLGLVH